MATVYDEPPQNNNDQRYIGIISLPEDMNQMIKSEAIINIKQKMERNGWTTKTDFAQGRDHHVFVFELSQADQVTFPEKARDDWTNSIDPYESVAFGPDGEIDPYNYEQ